MASPTAALAAPIRFLIGPALLSLLAASAAAQDDRLLPLDGAWIAGKVESADATNVTLAGGRNMELQRLQRIERPVKPEELRPAVILHLIDGSIIRAQDLTADSNGCRIRWAGADALVVPLSAIRGIRLAAPDKGKADPAPLPAFEKALGDNTAKQDVLHVVVDGQPQSVEGALQQIDAKDISFVWGGSARKISRTKAYGLTFAATVKPPDLSGQCLVRTADGSSAWGRLKSMKAGRLVLAAHEIEIPIPWDRVTQLSVRSDRVTYLSDLDPVEVVEEALVTFAGPWRRDRGVMGGPLTIGSAVYERGLGVHSLCSLTFAADGKYAAFSAIIGIDASAKSKGDCIFKVAVDGKEVFSQRVRGADKPTPVRVDITGANRVTLTVEPGEDLDLSDHADWCEARFEKAVRN